eukprot:m.59647 g.59647  ORF g.59647 m.59647 type:complete len:57 (+) comp34891_c0_seq9:1562-1732(+)
MSRTEAQASALELSTWTSLACKMVMRNQEYTSKINISKNIFGSKKFLVVQEIIRKM